ncbi:YnfU family zinc-binding protein [Cronobacter dublinensis]
MAIHKRKSQDSYLSRVTCPKCSEKAEHSSARVNKKKTLICPTCNHLFVSAPTPAN